MLYRKPLSRKLSALQGPTEEVPQPPAVSQRSTAGFHCLRFRVQGLGLKFGAPGFQPGQVQGLRSPRMLNFSLELSNSRVWEPFVSESEDFF